MLTLSIVRKTEYLYTRNCFFSGYFPGVIGGLPTKFRLIFNLGNEKLFLTYVVMYQSKSYLSVLVMAMDVFFGFKICLDFYKDFFHLLIVLQYVLVAFTHCSTVCSCLFGKFKCTK